MILNKIIICLLILLTILYAQESFVLELDNDALLILEETEFRVTGTNSATLKYNTIIQINNPAGKKYSEYSYSENQYHRVEDIEAVIKDLNGEIIRELDEDDIHHSSISQNISDGVNYWFNLYSPKYPYIFECSLEYECQTLFNWPDWYPGADIPTFESRYRLILEEPVSFKTFPVGLEISPDVTVQDGDSVYTWRLKNIPAREKTYRLPPENKYKQKVLFASNQFSVDEYAGTNESWDEFANWNRKLYHGKKNLSESAILKVKQLTASARNDYEKIQMIYSYLQENTRYVAIELGIGGWQPYDAEWVFTKKYGDCKDLSICMIAMLDAVDIKAYPTLMKTRDAGIVYTDFPSNQFNHVLVFIPLGQDTIWVEPTADLLKAGELPPNREGCHVVVIKENSSELLTTPQSQSKYNLETSRIDGTIRSWSGLKFIANLRYTGHDKSRILSLSRTKDRKKIEKYIQDHLGGYESHPELDQYQFNNLDDQMTLSMSGKFKSFANQTTARIFFNPNIVNRIDFNEDLKEEEREFPLYFSYPYVEIDTIAIKIPFATEIESAPPAIDIDSSFARYKIDYKFVEKELLYVRHFEIKHRLIPANSYNDYVKFMLSVEKNDRKKFVFKKF